MQPIPVFYPKDPLPNLVEIVDALMEPLAEADIQQEPLHGVPMPSLPVLTEIMQRLKAALFPAYFGKKEQSESSTRHHLAANLDSILHLLAEQIRSGGCFTCADFCREGVHCEMTSMERSVAFIKKLPEIRKLLASDVKAAFEGDPAAKTPGEALFCYPSLTAMMHHRIAHELYKLDVPLIPRIISEMSHAVTGIDIHPGATIGREFFIDHGTGVVIGETAIIGDKCRLYQGVTLGALSFPKDKQTGMLVKGNPRHPILEDSVTVYAGATILGRITIGSGSVIGGNVWLTEDVAPKSRILQQQLTSSPC